MKAIDLIGQRFGRLIVMANAESVRTPSGSERRVVVRCDCGKEKKIASGLLRSGRSKSCGCLREENRAKQATRHGDTPTGKKTAEYRSWAALKSRCTNQKDAGYKYYGARGIRVCERWAHGDGNKTGYECFLADMGRKPSPKHSIDRFPEKYGPYAPENCRWATKIEQANNTRSNIEVSIGGSVMTLAEACTKYGAATYDTTLHRINRGWPVERAIFEEVQS